MEQTVIQSTSTDGLEKSAVPNRSISVRFARTSDLSFMVSEAKEFAKFYGGKQSLFPGDELAREGFLNLMRQKHPFFVSFVDNEPSGFIGGYLTQHPFNPNLRWLAESFWWVKEKFRNTRSGLVLLNEFIDYGRKKADRITMTLEHHSPVNEKSLLRRGFQSSERVFLLEVD